MSHAYRSIFFFFVLIAGFLSSHGSIVRGIVRDSVSMESLPYASVRSVNGKTQSVADKRGIFTINADLKNDTLIISCMGYTPKNIILADSRLNLYDISLRPDTTNLAEVIIKKKKYSKHNNPAVEFVNQLKKKSKETDPLEKPFYSNSLYEKITLAINDFDTASSSFLLSSMPFIIEHVDTSEINGKPILDVSVKEKYAKSFYRRAPRTTKTFVEAIKSNGIDEVMEQENVDVILEELLKEIDLYNDNITLLRNTFVSPLSKIGPDFYRYYIVDSAATVDGDSTKYRVLAFYPRNKSYFGFKGHLYIAADDPAMIVRRVQMTIPEETNMNFVDMLKIEQTFSKDINGVRLKDKDYLFMELSVLPNTPQLYVSRKLDFSNHSFEKPANIDSIFGLVGDSFVDSEASLRDSIYWNSVRNGDLQKGEGSMALMMQRLRSHKLYYWGEKVIKAIVRGYISIGENSKFDYGPINTTASYNALEGLRLRAGGFTTANLNPHIFGRGYIAYGFRDRKWKYAVEGEYSFNRKKYHPGEFPIHSIRLKHRYDIDRLGSHYLYTNADNFVLSLARLADNRFAYRRDSELTYTLEMSNHLSFSVSANRVREEASPYVEFVNGKGVYFKFYNENCLSASIRYAPGEKFIQSRSERVKISQGTPVFIIKHLWAPGIFGSYKSFSRTEASVEKDFNLSILGRLQARINGGIVWGSAPFPELFIPNANLSYTIQPGTFALLNPMEFMNSAYCSLHLNWHLRGALFNLIPGIKKLKLREVFGFSTFYGTLNDKCNPKYNSELFSFPDNAGIIKMNKPYMEASVGLDNILSILRVDYVWRLNYRNVPYHIDRSGLRIALHFTF